MRTLLAGAVVGEPADLAVRQIALGVSLLDRHRSGAKVSDEGRELLPHIIGVLESVDPLRRRGDSFPRAVRELHAVFVERANGLRERP